MKRQIITTFVALILAAGIAGCNSSGTSSTTSTETKSTYTVGGTISGLSGSITLQNNGADNLALSANGTFTFAAAADDGSSYAVTVNTQPAGQACTVSNESGTISGANITNVVIACSNTVALKSIAVLQAHPDAAYGPAEQFIAVGVYSDDSVAEITTPVTWSSSDTAVATISTTGLAAKVSMGSTTVTVTDPSTGITGSADVSIASTNLNAESIAAGGTTVMAVLFDGSVMSWGGNTYGQLGDGTSTNQSSPVYVEGLTNVASVAVGGWHSVAVKYDGTVWAWGDNCCGQLGNGLSDGVTTLPLPPHPAPTQVSGLTNVTAVAAALFHTAALKSDGTVWTWGYNSVGQLGNGTNTDSLVPVQVSGLTGVTAIAAGGQFSAALKSDGTVWTWGYNPYGQLGNGTTTDSNVPVQVSGLTNVAAIAGGASHAMAVKSDGTVWAWGFNYYGQLGDGTTTDSSTPVQVSGLTGVTKVAAGGAQSVALKSDGTAWAWGNNDSGQLGDGTTTNRSTPVQFNSMTGVRDIAANFNEIIAMDGIGSCGDGRDGKGNGTKGSKGCSDVTAEEIRRAMQEYNYSGTGENRCTIFASYKYNPITREDYVLLEAFDSNDFSRKFPIDSVTSSDPSFTSVSRGAFVRYVHFTRPAYKGSAIVTVTACGITKSFLLNGNGFDLNPSLR